VRTHPEAVIHHSHIRIRPRKAFHDSTIVVMDAEGRVTERVTPADFVKRRPGVSPRCAPQYSGTTE
jgi:hypothetical protein